MRLPSSPRDSLGYDVEGGAHGDGKQEAKGEAHVEAGVGALTAAAAGRVQAVVAPVEVLGLGWRGGRGWGSLGVCCVMINHY